MITFFSLIAYANQNLYMLVWSNNVDREEELFTNFMASFEYFYGNLGLLMSTFKTNNVQISFLKIPQIEGSKRYKDWLLAM